MVKETGDQSGIHEDPTSAIKPIAIVVNLNRRRRQLSPSLRSPGQGIEVRINRTGRASATIEIHRTQANDRAVASFPLPGRNREWNFGIALELQTFRSGCLLILVDHERPHEPHAVVTEVPPRAIVDGSSAEWPPAEDQQISSAIEVALYGRPVLLGKCRSVRKHQYAGRCRTESRAELIGRGQPGPREQGAKLLPGRCRRVCRGEVWFVEHGHGGSEFLS